MENTTFGAVIRQRRLDLKLSLKEASKKTGLTASRIHDLEAGRSSTTAKPTAPTRENIRKLSRGYQLPEDYLLDLVGRPKLDPDTDEEKRLLTLFRELSPGHKEALLGLASHLFSLDQNQR